MKKLITIAVFVAIIITISGTVVSAQTLKQQDDAAKAKYQQVRQSYLNAVNFYKSARQEFVTARQKYNQFKNAQNKKVLEDEARDFLTKAVEVSIKRLEILRTKAENIRIEESEREKILAEIDKDINWLRARLPKVQTASPTQIKEEAKAVREYWKKIRLTEKRVAGQILAARINYLIKKAEAFSNSVSAKIAELKASNTDKSKLQVWLLESWLNQYNSKLTLAKAKYELAKAKYAAIKGEPGPDFVKELQEADSLAKEGHQFILEANQYIREAHALLVRIVKVMKNTGGIKFGDGTGTLTAKGDGRAAVVLYNSGDKITVKGEELDVVLVSGTDEWDKYYSIETNLVPVSQVPPDPSNIPTKEYVQGVKGEIGEITVNIIAPLPSGTWLTVYVNNPIVTTSGDERARNAELTAEGTGSYFLVGKGTYTVCNSSQVCQSNEEWEAE